MNLIIMRSQQMRATEYWWAKAHYVALLPAVKELSDEIDRRIFRAVYAQIANTGKLSLTMPRRFAHT